MRIRRNNEISNEIAKGGVISNPGYWGGGAGDVFSNKNFLLSFGAGMKLSRKFCMGYKTILL